MHAEKALPHLHHARAAAGTAILDLTARLGPGTGADIAVFLGGNADLRVFAIGRFFQRHLHRIAQVATAKHLASAAPAALLLAEHLTKNIPKGLGETAHPFATRAAHIRVHTGVAVLVVSGTLLRVGQHLVGLFGLFEFDFRLFRRFPLVAVRVELHRQLTVGLFNFLVRSGLG